MKEKIVDIRDDIKKLETIEEVGENDSHHPHINSNKE